MEKLLKILNNFTGKNILVVGDVMLDKYIQGKVERISPEAPVPVVHVQEEEFRLGGAANVAMNIKDLGGTAMLVGVVGKDLSAKILKKKLRKEKILHALVTDISRPTIEKVRILAHDQQLARLDYEDSAKISSFIERGVIKKIKEFLPNAEAVVVSDYAKGVITAKIMKVLRLSKKMILVDPKPKNKNLYKKVDFVTPNHKEAAEMAGLEEKTENDLKQIGKKLVRELSAHIFITRGDKGIAYFNRTRSFFVPAQAKEIFDVTGAGDTAIATLAISLIAGANPREAAILANQAGGIVVGKLGAATVTIPEIKKALHEEK